MDKELPEWAAGLPEALHDAPYLRDADSAESFVQQVANAAQHMGNSLRMPGPDSSPEQMQEFQAKAIEKIPGLMNVPDPTDIDSFKGIMSKLGRPDTADQYKLPQDVEIDVDTLGKLRSQAHKFDMTQHQFEQQARAVVGEMTEAQATQARMIETDRQVLKEEWGYAYADHMGEIAGFLKKDKNTPAAILSAFCGGCTRPASWVMRLHSWVNSRMAARVPWLPWKPKPNLMRLRRSCSRMAAPCSLQPLVTRIWWRNAWS